MTQPTITFGDYLNTFGDDLSRLRGVMRTNLGTSVSLIADMETDYLIGGKCVRATVALLAARLCKLDTAIADNVAVAIEFIHTATLLHDDVVDNAPMRRHFPSAAAAYGNAAAVLAGDFLYSRASQMLANQGSVGLLQCIADATNKLSEGEILQLLHSGSADLDEETYYTIIQRKTANLFEAAAVAAAILTNTDKTPLLTYGRHLGLAFQLIDDYLDYAGDDTKTGKKIGTDFDEGKTTLPIILTLARVDADKRQWLTDVCQDRRREAFADILQLMRECGALDDMRIRAEQEANTAVDAIVAAYPKSPEREALVTLAKVLPHRPI